MSDTSRLPYDNAYKLLFSHPERVEGLFKDFVPEDFMVELDFSSSEQCPISYVAEDLRERH